MRLVWIIVALLHVIIDATPASVEFNKTQSGDSHKDVDRRLRADKNESEDRWFFSTKVLSIPEYTDRRELVQPLLQSLQLHERDIVVNPVTAIPPNGEVETQHLMAISNGQLVAIHVNAIPNGEVETLFTNPQFKSWVNQFHKDEKSTTLELDKVIYDGLTQVAERKWGSLVISDRLAEMIDVALRSPERKTNQLAQKLERVRFRVLNSNQHHTEDTLAASVRFLFKLSKLPRAAWQTRVDLRYLLYIRGILDPELGHISWQLSKVSRNLKKLERAEKQSRKTSLQNSGQTPAASEVPNDSV